MAVPSDPQQGYPAGMLSPGDDSPIVTTPYWQGRLADAPAFGRRLSGESEEARVENTAPSHGRGPGDTSAAVLMAWPRMQRVPTAKAEVFACPDFLDEAHCAALIALIDANPRPSTITVYNGDDAFRTSQTCDLAATEPAVMALEKKLRQVSGIAIEHGELLQGQRYDPGQEFKGHTDYFEPFSAEWDEHCSVSGQRTWTFMIYLNDVEAGGTTRFKALDKMVKPVTGKLLAWNNLLPDGRPNPATLHHALKVRKGRKYVITRWYREKPCR